MSIVDNMAKAAMHKAITSMVTPQKLIDIEEAVVAKIAEEGLVGNFVHSMLQTMGAALIEFADFKKDEGGKDEPSI